MSNGYTEDHLVEQPAMQLMQHELGWDVSNCYGEWDGGTSALGRDGKREVVLVSRLRPALQRLNPDLPVEAIEGAVEEICRDRTALSLAEANREIDKLLKQGVKVSFPDQEHGGQRVEVVSVVDWEILPVEFGILQESRRNRAKIGRLGFFGFHRTVKCVF